MTHAQTVAPVHRVVRLRRPAARRPLPDRQPVLPHVRVQGRLARRACSAARRSCRSRCSTCRRCSTSCRPSASRCCPARRPSTARSSTIPRRDDYDLSTLAGGGHRRGRHPRRADRADARRAAVHVDPHRLRPHRGRARSPARGPTTTPTTIATTAGRAMPELEVIIADPEGPTAPSSSGAPPANCSCAATA